MQPATQRAKNLARFANRCKNSLGPTNQNFANIVFTLKVQQIFKNIMGVEAEYREYLRQFFSCF